MKNIRPRFYQLMSHTDCPELQADMLSCRAMHTRASFLFQTSRQQQISREKKAFSLSETAHQQAFWNVIKNLGLKKITK